MTGRNSIPSLAAVADALRSGTWPLLDYVDALEAQFERREPGILAFLPEAGRFERLRREAETLLAQYPQPAQRPPLFGVPVGVKDIFQVDGFETHAGSKLPTGLLQGEEAESVSILRRAGALILGKTVTTEFAYFAPGPTRNPYNPEHTPGGSSSGSAAAVGASLCPLALGTQTIGSINRPAAFCGVVGYKPSFDRISKAGVIPLSRSLDHVGLFTPSVAGLGIVAALLCYGWQEKVTASMPVLGIPEGPYLKHASESALVHFYDSCERLKTVGFTIKAVPAMDDFDQIVACHNRIVATEAARFHAGWFAEFGELYHHKTAELLRRGQQVDETVWMRDLGGRQQLRDELTGLMDNYGLDLWLSPAAPDAAPYGLESTGDPVMNLPWTHSGLPTLSLPTGLNENGLPLALQLVGRWYADEALLSWAETIEAVFIRK